jgi:hypothetical protein
MSTATREAPNVLSPEQAHQALRDVFRFAGPESAGLCAEAGWYITQEAGELWALAAAIGSAARLASHISTEMADVHEPSGLFNDNTVGALLELIHAGAWRLSGAFEHVQGIEHRWEEERRV